MPTVISRIFPAIICVFYLTAAVPAGPVYTADDVDLNAELPPDAVEPIFKTPKNVPASDVPTSGKTSTKTSAKTPPKTSAGTKTGPTLGEIAAASTWGMYVKTPADNPPKPKPKPVKKPAAKKNPKDAEDDDEEEFQLLTRDERNQKRIKYFRETGVLQWPEFSDDELKEIEKEQRTFLESIRAAFPTLLIRYYETKHFFYVTDAPEPIAKDCCLALETMYARLNEIFNVPEDQQVWKGKCIVVAFTRQQHFMEFEAKFFRYAARTTTAGLAHTSGAGDVLISLYYGDISRLEYQWRFIGVLVHETTHGFMHRYKTREHLPTWLEEGIAEYMAAAIVVKDKQVAQKQKSAMQIMQQTRSLGGLFVLDKLDAWQYGAASGVVSYLLKQKQGGVGQMVRMIKNGTDWQVAMQDVYGGTPDQLIVVFGNSIGIPGLQP